MECPVCRETMVVIEYRSIELDYCVGCMGVWFDRGEIELLLDDAGMAMDTGLPVKKLDSGTREISRPCPLCGKPMRKVASPGDSVILDQCPEGDGIWFDAGELAGTMKDLIGPDNNQVMEVLRKFLGEALAEPKRNEETE